MSRLVSMTEMLQKAKEGKYAVGQFNINNLEWTQAVLTAAQEANSPIILGVSEGAGKYMGGPKVVSAMVNALLDAMNITVPVALHLDHGSSVEVCKQYIDAGFSSVMFDHSHFPIDENIELTKEVVEYAKFTGALVESELHYFGGSSNFHNEAINYDEVKKTFSTPEGAKAFVDATGVDTFAAAIGNLHGKYSVPKILDLNLLTSIRQSIDCAISLHGGSGTPLHYFEDAAKIGVSKININSDMRYVFRTTLEKVLADNPNEYAIVKLMPKIYTEVQAVVEEKINAFGSAGKVFI